MANIPLISGKVKVIRTGRLIYNPKGRPVGRVEVDNSKPDSTPTVKFDRGHSSGTVFTNKGRINVSTPTGQNKTPVFSAESLEVDRGFSTPTNLFESGFEDRKGNRSVFTPGLSRAEVTREAKKSQVSSGRKPPEPVKPVFDPAIKEARRTSMPTKTFKRGFQDLGGRRSVFTGERSRTEQETLAKSEEIRRIDKREAERKQKELWADIKKKSVSPGIGGFIEGGIEVTTEFIKPIFRGANKIRKLAEQLPKDFTMTATTFINFKKALKEAEKYNKLWKNGDLTKKKENQIKSKIKSYTSKMDKKELQRSTKYISETVKDSDVHAFLIFSGISAAGASAGALGGISQVIVNTGLRGVGVVQSVKEGIALIKKKTPKQAGRLVAVLIPTLLSLKGSKNDAKNIVKAFKMRITNKDLALQAKYFGKVYTNRMPNTKTLKRVFRGLDAKTAANLKVSLVKTISKGTGGRTVYIDGKAINSKGTGKPIVKTTKLKGIEIERTAVPTKTKAGTIYKIKELRKVITEIGIKVTNKLPKIKGKLVMRGNNLKNLVKGDLSRQIRAKQFYKVTFKNGKISKLKLMSSRDTNQLPGLRKISEKHSKIIKQELIDKVKIKEPLIKKEKIILRESKPKLRKKPAKGEVPTSIKEYEVDLQKLYSKAKTYQKSLKDIRLNKKLSTSRKKELTSFVKDNIRETNTRRNLLIKELSKDYKLIIKNSGKIILKPKKSFSGTFNKKKGIKGSSLEELSKSIDKSVNRRKYITKEELAKLEAEDANDLQKRLSSMEIDKAKALQKIKEIKFKTTKKYKIEQQRLQNKLLKERLRIINSQKQYEKLLLKRKLKLAKENKPFKITPEMAREMEELREIMLIEKFKSKPKTKLKKGISLDELSKRIDKSVNRRKYITEEELIKPEPVKDSTSSTQSTKEGQVVVLEKPKEVIKSKPKSSSSTNTKSVVRIETLTPEYTNNRVFMLNKNLGTEQRINTVSQLLISPTQEVIYNEKTNNISLLKPISKIQQGQKPLIKLEELQVSKSETKLFPTFKLKSGVSQENIQKALQDVAQDLAQNQKVSQKSMQKLKSITRQETITLNPNMEYKKLLELINGAFINVLPEEKEKLRKYLNKLKQSKKKARLYYTPTLAGFGLPAQRVTGQFTGFEMRGSEITVKPIKVKKHKRKTLVNKAFVRKHRRRKPSGG